MAKLGRSVPFLALGAMLVVLAHCGSEDQASSSSNSSAASDAGAGGQPSPDAAPTDAAATSDGDVDDAGSDAATPSQLTTVSTFAGGTYGWADGTGKAAQFLQPMHMVFGPTGDLFVPDYLAVNVRRLTPSADVTTFAGDSTFPGYADGAGSTAQFRDPSGIAADPAGNLFISEVLNYDIRKIAPSVAVTTFAGLGGSSGYKDAVGTAARFQTPFCIVYDPADGALYVGDKRIRKIAADGTVTTFAGSGTSDTIDGNGTNAGFNEIRGIAIAPNGDIFVAESAGHVIRRITKLGDVTTVAGMPGVAGEVDGVGSAARFDTPWGIAFDAKGFLYVADQGGQTVRRVDTTSFAVTTIAGAAKTAGYVDGALADARFDQPTGIAVRGATVFVSEWGNFAIRKIE